MPWWNRPFGEISESKLPKWQVLKAIAIELTPCFFTIFAWNSSAFNHSDDQVHRTDHVNTDNLLSVLQPRDRFGQVVGGVPGIVGAIFFFGIGF